MSISPERPSSLPSLSEMFLIDDVNEVLQQEADAVAIDRRASESNGILIVGRLDTVFPDLTNPCIHISRKPLCEDASPTTFIIIDYEIDGETVIFIIGQFSPDEREYVDLDKPSWLLDGADEEGVEDIRYFIRMAEWDSELTAKVAGHN